jgi:hypothetical protein
MLALRDSALDRGRRRLRVCRDEGRGFEPGAFHGGRGRSQGGGLSAQLFCSPVARSTVGTAGRTSSDLVSSPSRPPASSPSSPSWTGPARPQAPRAVDHRRHATTEPSLKSFVAGPRADHDTVASGLSLPGAPAPSKAMSTASKCLNGKCTDARTQTYSAPRPPRRLARREGSWKRCHRASFGPSPPAVCQVGDRRNLPDIAAGDLHWSLSVATTTPDQSACERQPSIGMPSADAKNGRRIADLCSRRLHHGPNGRSR